MEEYILEILLKYQNLHKIVLISLIVKINKINKKRYQYLNKKNKKINNYHYNSKIYWKILIFKVNRIIKIMRTITHKILILIILIILIDIKQIHWNLKINLIKLNQNIINKQMHRFIHLIIYFNYNLYSNKVSKLTH